MAKSIIALYEEPESASSAVWALLQDGFESQTISLIYPARAGASGALLAATGIGLEIGGVNDGLGGALVGMDFPRELAKNYADGVRRGGVLVTIAAPESRTGWAEVILRRYGPVDLGPQAETGDLNGQEKAEEKPTLFSLDRDFEDLEPSFRAHFKRSSLRSVSVYEKFRPAYFYGFTLATDEELQEAAWNDIEPEARRHWEDLDPGSWRRYRDIVRAAWEHTRAAEN